MHPDHAELGRIFLQAREIPYRIPLSPEERNDSCVGKHFLIKEGFERLGHHVRWAECTFDWKDLGVPEDILSLEHATPDFHVWLEVLVGDQWQTLDATWDSGLRSTLPVNEWSDLGKMAPAVPILKMIPYEKVVVTKEFPEEERARWEKERPFLDAVNKWLQSIRVGPPGVQEHRF